MLKISMADTVASSRSLIGQNGFAISKTTGSSMRPLIWGGRHCVVVAPLEGEPAIGDILMFEHTGADGKTKTVVHRLVEISHQGPASLYLTRGDNCLGVECVDRTAIIGRVVEVHRLGGYRPWFAIGSRKFSVTDPRHRRYTRLWAATWPARRVLFRLRAIARVLPSRLSLLFKKER